MSNSVEEHESGAKQYFSGVFAVRVSDCFVKVDCIKQAPLLGAKESKKI